jgi:hypothetical protein
VGGDIEARNPGRIDVRRAIRIQLRQLEWRPTCERDGMHDEHVITLHVIASITLIQICDYQIGRDPGFSIGLHQPSCLLTWSCSSITLHLHFTLPLKQTSRLPSTLVLCFLLCSQPPFALPSNSCDSEQPHLRPRQHHLPMVHPCP